jgi:tRNA (guanine-N7-)-methyltransferase
MHCEPGASKPPGILYPLPSILHRIDQRQMFAREQPLEVELGSGDASFLLQYAAHNPDRNFIGIERLLGRISKMDRKGRRLGLGNLRGVRIESSYFLEHLLPPHSVSTLHVYFPDPWPKRKHLRHRLVNERFALLCHEALQPGGTIYLRTDDTPYFAQMRAVFGSSPFFEETQTPDELALLVTDFEKDFLARNIITLRVAYRNKVPPGSRPAAGTKRQ